MIISFPTQSNDWFKIWKEQGHMNLPNVHGIEVGFVIDDLYPLYEHRYPEQVVAAQVMLPGDEHFFVAFYSDLDLDQWAVYEFTGVNPKKGKWRVDLNRRPKPATKNE